MRKLVLLVLLGAFGMAACGQRGPLYIPGKPGDPNFDRRNRGATPQSVPPGQNTTKPKREDDEGS